MEVNLDKLGSVDTVTAPPAPAVKNPISKLMRANALKSLEQAFKQDSERIHKANEEFKKSVNGG